MRSLGDGGEDAFERVVRHAFGALGRSCRQEPLGRGREEIGFGVVRIGTDGKERGIVVGNGIGSRCTLTGVIGREECSVPSAARTERAASRG